MKNVKLEIEESCNEPGFTILVDGRWVVDASIFLSDYEIVIDKKSLKKSWENVNNVAYKLKPSIIKNLTTTL